MEQYCPFTPYLSDDNRLSACPAPRVGTAWSSSHSHYPFICTLLGCSFASAVHCFDLSGQLGLPCTHLLYYYCCLSKSIDTNTSAVTSHSLPLSMDTITLYPRQWLGIVTSVASKIGQAFLLGLFPITSSAVNPLPNWSNICLSRSLSLSHTIGRSSG